MTSKVRTSLCGLFAVGTLVVLLSMLMAPNAHAATALRYIRGYSVQGSWLCYGWSSGVYHCTQQWHWSSGHPISDTSYVPRMGTGTALSGGTLSATSTRQVSSGQPCRTAVVWPSRISQWTVPLGCYSGIYFPNPANYPSRPSYGWCNWWPEVLHPWLGGNTALHLRSHGGYAPIAGAVVFFSPNVQGASRDGHYAQVVAVHGSWVLITEMNFYWRGGGFKKVDYRFIHTGSGVDFRY